jgi:peptidyl-prolyl cis-trans isomerase SurA
MEVFTLKRMSWLVSAILVATLATFAHAQRLDGIAAVVNDDVVLHSDIEEQLALLLMRAQQEPDSVTIDTLRTEILNQLIDEKLIVAEAKRQGLTAADAEIARELDKAMLEIRQRFGGEEGFRAQLAKENTTEDKLRDKYREEIRRQLIANKLMTRTFPAKKVTAAEAEAYFAANKAKFPKMPAELKLAVIQIPVVADSSVEAKAKAQAAALRKRVAGGEKFAKVAAESSEDPATARNGGDLGFLPRGMLDPELDDAAFSLKFGELSSPLRSSVGWHILEVLDRDTVKTRAGKDSLDVRGRPAMEAHVRHLLVRVPLQEADAERAKKLADRVRAEAAKGGDFAALVKRYSKYEGPASPDGDLGFVSLGTLTPNIRAGLDTVPVGGVSEVLTNPVGFNIFKVSERKPEREYQLEEIKAELPDVVTQMKQRERYKEWIQGLRTKAHIEVRKS